MNFKEFQKYASATGLRVRDCGHGHWRIEGGTVEVNYWPLSRKKSAFVDGTTISIKDATPEQVVELALTGPKKVPFDARRKRTGSSRRNKLRMMAIDPTCAFCGCELTDKTATVDHIVPLARGGSNWLDNLQLACKKCNQDPIYEAAR